MRLGKAIELSRNESENNLDKVAPLFECVQKIHEKKGYTALKTGVEQRLNLLKQLDLSEITPPNSTQENLEQIQKKHRDRRNLLAAATALGSVGGLALVALNKSRIAKPLNRREFLIQSIAAAAGGVVSMTASGVLAIDNEARKEEDRSKKLVKSKFNEKLNAFNSKRIQAEVEQTLREISTSKRENIVTDNIILLNWLYISSNKEKQADKLADAIASYIFINSQDVNETVSELAGSNSNPDNTSSK